MIEPAVAFDGSMCVAWVGARLSWYSDLMWCVVRDEAGGSDVWSVLDVAELLAEIGSGKEALPLREAVALLRHRADVCSVSDRKSLRSRVRHTVVLDGTDLVGVIPGEGFTVIPGVYREWLPGIPPDGEPSRVERFLAWPRLSAPSVVHCGGEFMLTIALSREQHDATSPIVVELDESMELDLDVDVAAIGFDAPAGWRRTLHVHSGGELPSVSLPLRVRSDAPPGRALIHVAFLHRGIVCGNATWAVLVGAGDWTVIPGAVSPCSVPEVDEEAADLVVMIRKADGNCATGRYVWSMSSIRTAIDCRSFEIDLGEDPRTFARALMRDIEESEGALLENVLRSIGMTIATYVPAAFWDALRAVARSIADDRRPPSVLLYSAEEFVPWELALMPRPLDDGAPFLACQTMLGRWLHSQSGVIPPHPSSAIRVGDFAVIALDAASPEGDGLSLQWAQEEARHLVEAYGAIEVAATEEDVRRLLDAELKREDGSPAEPAVVHFACHGTSNPMLPGFAGLFLSSGKRLTPYAFGASKLGRKWGPLLFLNACEVGMGQRLLADNAGFAGVALRGGFRAFVAPLWSVDDEASSRVGQRFYKATLGDGASVGGALREIRRLAQRREATPLSYVYYGHPHLRLCQEGGWA